MKIIDELVNSYSKTQKQMIKDRTYYKMQLWRIEGELESDEPDMEQIAFLLVGLAAGMKLGVEIPTSVYCEDGETEVYTMKDISGKRWIPMFTSTDEHDENVDVSMSIPLERLVREAYYRDDIDGLVIDPFSEGFTVTKKQLKFVLEFYEL